MRTRRPEREAAAATRRFRAIIAYDGTDFDGWQVQPGRRTVQGELETAIESVIGSRPRVFCSGRTDAGVHARGQVVHVDLPRRMPAWQYQRALNSRLPPDVRVTRIAGTRPDFDARFSATGKEYRYFIWNDPVEEPSLRRHRDHVKVPLDVAKMRTAAAHLVGRHDFAAFSANPGHEREGTVRTVHAITVRKSGGEIIIAARGEGFLYRMVRSLAGYLIRVGAGELDPDGAPAILASRTRTASVPTAAARGLFLWRVFYARGATPRAAGVP